MCEITSTGWIRLNFWRNILNSKELYSHLNVGAPNKPNVKVQSDIITGNGLLLECDAFTDENENNFIVQWRGGGGSYIKGMWIIQAGYIRTCCNVSCNVCFNLDILEQVGYTYGRNTKLIWTENLIQDTVIVGQILI